MFLTWTMWSRASLKMELYVDAWPTIYLLRFLFGMLDFIFCGKICSNMTKVTLLIFWDCLPYLVLRLLDPFAESATMHKCCNLTSGSLLPLYFLNIKWTSFRLASVFLSVVYMQLVIRWLIHCILVLFDNLVLFMQHLRTLLLKQAMQVQVIGKRKYIKW